MGSLGAREWGQDSRPRLPPLSGFLVQYLGWRAVFLFILPPLLAQRRRAWSGGWRRDRSSLYGPRVRTSEERHH